ncbi:MAG: hypothetical protein JOZ19_04950 [Rubrobacter sp.]|nr:hypothetical protein [Rubrobacter sp.]
MAKRRLEFLVEGTPDVVLNMVQGFFEKEEWSPYPVQWDRNVLGGGRSRRAVVTRLDDPIKGHNKVVASISAFPILEAPLGFLELVALSLLTAGLFLVAYTVWTFLFRKQVTVTTVPDEPGWTKLTTEATKPEHTEDLVAWIQRELIENRAAARVETL